MVFAGQPYIARRKREKVIWLNYLRGTVMKTKIIFFVLSLFVLQPQNFAGDKISQEKKKIDKEVILNLLEGVNSDNYGLRLSSAFFLGEYKASEAIIPLMKMLHDEKTEEARIVAALSLMKIGSDKAVYAVKEASSLDNSQRVRRLCTLFYNAQQNGLPAEESRDINVAERKDKDSKKKSGMNK